MHNSYKITNYIDMKQIPPPTLTYFNPSFYKRTLNFLIVTKSPDPAVTRFPALGVRNIYLGLAEKLWWFVITSGLVF